jgi:hypothetical protein
MLVVKVISAINKAEHDMDKMKGDVSEEGRKVGLKAVIEACLQARAQILGHTEDALDALKALLKEKMELLPLVQAFARESSLAVQV